MRPQTLAEAVSRLQDGAEQDKALAEFLDTFYLAPTDADRYAPIAEEPEITGDERLDAWVGAMAEYLAKQYRLRHVPRWVSGPKVTSSFHGTRADTKIPVCANTSL